jgi:hypothetical protein
MTIKGSMLSIANEFSQYPGPRYKSQGDDSGEEFYKKLLNKRFAEAYKKAEKLVVDLDGCAGYATSFLDEAFGELVYDFSLKLVKEYLEIVSVEEPQWVEVIQRETFEEWEKRRVSKKKPTRQESFGLYYYDCSTKTISTRK